MGATRQDAPRERSGGEANGNAAAAVPSYTPGPRGLAHLELILNGGYPLPGFMTRAEAAAVARDGRLPDGTPWPVPVTLPVPEDLAGAGRVLLTDPEGAPLAELDVTESWRAEDENDGPGGTGGHARATGADPEAGHRHRLAGEVRLARPPVFGSLRHLRLSPAEVRRQLEISPVEVGAEPAGRPVLAVVTGRPLHHRSLHEIRAAADGLAGDGPGGEDGREVLVIIDVPLHDDGVAPAVMAAEPLLPARARFVVTTLPTAGDDVAVGTGSAGERHTLLAAHVARSYGATHVLVNRAPDEPAPGSLDGAAPIPVLAPRPWSYDTAEELWRPADRVPEGRARPEPGDAEVEELLAHGRDLPAWFTPARVATELARLRPARTRRGLVVFLTGLSGSGKSTIARGVAEGVRRAGRTVTLLDGDVVRRMLSAGLTFSRADRDLNIRRIGYVAAEIARHGGVAVCAPIAPYAATRAEVRAMAEETGDFFLVHVATPLEVCEARDVKGLYARARAGEIAEFTGVSDPYEEPEDAELVLDTDGSAPEESVAEVLTALRAGGWLPDHRP